ncbi:MAG TPA: transcriptional regulator [Clostridiales bacterium]|nr:transcriptional regulator [Clostridiales bacterium]
MKKHLQYAFLMNADDQLIPCDQASKNFLGAIDANAFFAHLQCLHLSSSDTSTTIILNKTSYSMRLIPIEAVGKSEKDSLVSQLKEGYIVVLQNQVSLSSVMHILSRARHSKEEYEGIFEDYDTGIYITRADGVSMFINSKYEEVTGVQREAVIGRTIFSLHEQGMYMPLVTPVILKTNKEYTVFQTFAGGRYAIICGTPIYDALGESYCVLICINRVEDEALGALVPFMDKKSPKGVRKGLRYVESSQIDIIAESASTRQVLQDAVKVAHYDVPILLLGESGTGKEIFASIIHSSSNRRFNPYVAVNCSAISPSLLEAELFGYEAGSFTGASAKGKPGLFEVAGEGTILLDEIGDMPLESQAKILRVIQNGEFYRVGGLVPIKTNARIIASTNKDLQAMVNKGTFRNDLFYRLSVIPITLPALRFRKEDIPPLLLHFCYIFNQSYGTNKMISAELIDELVNYSWPGNIRELKNVIKRLIIMCVDDVIYPRHYEHICGKSAQGADHTEGTAVQVTGIPPLSSVVEEVERTLVQRAMEKTRNTRKAAALLGVSQSTIMRKIKEYNIS